jgi:proteasome lid subunit RPN8/RPN11
MNIRTSLTLWATAVVCLTGAVVVIVVHSDAGTSARPTDFQTRFQPALRPDAHIGSFRQLTPVPLDDPAHPGPARTSGPTAEERRHGSAQAHP